MAIYLRNSDTLILLITKTGSKWIQAALQRGKVTHEMVGPPESRGHEPLSYHGRNFSCIACFVRNPIAWYRSYWSYRMERGWRPKYTLDLVCQHNDFKTFVRNVARNLPGIVSEFYASFAGPANDPIDFIGKQEQLEDDLVRLLKQRNESFDEAALRSTPKANTTSIVPEYPDELKELIAVTEFEAMRRYNYPEANYFSLNRLAAAYPEDISNLLKLAIWTAKTHWDPDDAKLAAGRIVSPGTRCARLYGNFALYMEAIRNDNAEAKQFYLDAIQADPRHPRTLGNYALFIERTSSDNDEAEIYYRKALEVRPDHVFSLGNYAVFLEKKRKEYDKAEYYYKHALKIAPNILTILTDYANFLKKVKHDEKAANAVVYKIRKLRKTIAASE